jgi:tryptophan synthase beta chain
MNYKEQILNTDGYFGEYGGSFIPEVIQPNIKEIVEAFDKYKNDPEFIKELHTAYKELSGRPTALTPCHTLSEELGGAKIYIKNEGLNHTGAHKINHCIGQILLAKKLGKKRIIAETGAGQHGYATATVCARYGMECVIYMGKKDYERQRPNVYWMELLGAKVIAVEEGEQTLNDAVIAAFKDLIAHPEDSFYLLGSALGPHPYPAMNTYFQKVVSEEMKDQLDALEGKLPDYVLACVGGGSNAMGAFFNFLDDETVKLIAVEAGGIGTEIGEHATKLKLGKKGIFEGYYSYFLQDNDGNISSTHSVSAGLDYCGVSPILAHLMDEDRIEVASVFDEEALNALKKLAQKEGLILALESIHAFAHALKLAPTLSKDQVIIVNGSGRGEKDLFITMKHFQEDSLKTYINQLFD